MAPAQPPLPPEATAVNGLPVSGEPTGRGRLAAALRQLSEVVVGRRVPDADFARVADHVAALTAELEAVAEPGLRGRRVTDPSGHPQDYFPTSPATGLKNPVAPPLEVWAVPGPDGQPELGGRATFGFRFEGPPTCVHGGVLAEAFDELLGSVNILAGRPGMTGTLTVRFHRPTPLMVELGLRARQVAVEGRKIRAWGGIYHDGQLTAEAEGIFIEVPMEAIRDIAAAHVGQGLVVDPSLAAYLEDPDATGERFGN